MLLMPLACIAAIHLCLWLHFCHLQQATKARRTDRQTASYFVALAFPACGFEGIGIYRLGGGKKGEKKKKRENERTID